VFADHAIGADLAGGGNLRVWVDDGGWMNHFMNTPRRSSAIPR
jgi:hypothetical protein